MDYKDYYKTLGVKRDASADEIKSAYRRLARKHHPDVNPGDKTAGARFKEINEAYEVLSDPDKKSRYDMWGRIPGMAGGPASSSAGGRASSPFGMPSFGGTRTQQAPGGGSRTRSGAGNLGDFSDFFHTLFGQGNGTSRSGQPQKGEDIEQSVEITLEEVMTGAQRVFSIRGQDRCPKCLGTTESPPGTLCAHCSGTGVVDYTRKIEVKIPQGVRAGSRIRIAGEGQPGTFGGPKGDLFLIVQIKNHASFTRDEDNIQTDVDVPFTRLILGGEVEAPTLKGRVVLKVPPQTQNGRVFRLTGKGLPRLKGTGAGDLLIRVRATLPAVVSPRVKELVEEIERLEATAH